MKNCIWAIRIPSEEFSPDTIIKSTVEVNGNYWKPSSWFLQRRYLIRTVNLFTAVTDFWLQSEDFLIKEQCFPLCFHMETNQCFSLPVIKENQTFWECDYLYFEGQLPGNWEWTFLDGFNKDETHCAFFFFLINLLLIERKQTCLNVTNISLFVCLCSSLPHAALLSGSGQSE